MRSAFEFVGFQLNFVFRFFKYDLCNSEYSTFILPFVDKSFPYVIFLVHCVAGNLQPMSYNDNTYIKKQAL